MDEILTEDIFDLFNASPLQSVKGKAIDVESAKFSIRRDDELHISLEVTRPFLKSDTQIDSKPGVIYQLTDNFTFEVLHGLATFCASGIILRGRNTTFDNRSGARTTERYSVHSFEMRPNSPKRSRYTVDFVSNTPEGRSYPHIIKCEEKITRTRTISDLVLEHKSETGGFYRGLHIHLHGYDLHFLPNWKKPNDGSRVAQIIYSPSPDEKTRAKLRDCISFCFGLPICYHGYSEYDSDWNCLYRKSIDIDTLDGAISKIHEMPPFPLHCVQNGTHSPFYDASQVGDIVRKLYDYYEQLGLEYLIWSYWRARAASVYVTPVQIGAIIEKLQNNNAIIDSEFRFLMQSKNWTIAVRAIKFILKPLIGNIDDTNLTILNSKIDGLNSAPAVIILDRIFHKYSLDLSAAEKNAWKSRNQSAHGGKSEKFPIKLIINGYVLLNIFHRLIAASTKCSKVYIDYSNIDYPIRLVECGTPERGPDSNIAG